jgi:hypothetical protein
MTEEEALAKGLRYYCVGCHNVTKEPPTEPYDDGHNGRPITMCECGCDLIIDLTTEQLV